MLRDGFGRVVTNLRIAVTNRCNLECFYCHKEGERNPGKEMSPDRIVEIAKAFHKLGVKKLKITGGEPLLRKDILDIIQEMPEFDEISMTTNGILLEKYAEELRECGLSRVNVSLDTLNAEKYRFITKVGDVEKVVSGISRACEVGLTPVKVNMLVLKGINDDEVENLLEFTNSFNSSEVRAILQLIELLPLPGLEKYFFDISSLEKKYSEIAFQTRIRAMHRRMQYFTPLGVIEFVKPLDNSAFCMHCNRMRVTSDGKLKPCLLRDTTISINGKHDDELINEIIATVRKREPYFKGEP
ncbi:GTP 3',8-cyclase MoaA [Archaeoglobus neptunius]|uniref:GTP 3',8-cyclase MoaA n=1 Tax=Archaeoglobus neptunius TaxID=2798580 RepID=UPI00192803ED|nr:GTP 3',8-cyclase MoaA [Archaeoglobus neptunius]